MRAHHPSAEFPSHLEELYARFPFERSLADDPISEVRSLAWDPRRARWRGVFASMLAVGNTTAIRGAIVRLAELAGGDVRWLVTPGHARERARRLAPFRHRSVPGATSSITWRASWNGTTNVTPPSSRHSSAVSPPVVSPVGSTSFPASFEGRRSVRPSVRPLGGIEPSSRARVTPRAVRASVSPCSSAGWSATGTRTLGVWHRVPTGELRIPLDQHVHWIAYHLGLTGRRTRSWAAVEEVSEALRRIDPLDPTKYDFVLCHTGISGDCPKERDISVCGPCSVRPDCLLWRGRTVLA